MAQQHLRIFETGKITIEIMKITLEDAMDPMDGTRADDEEIHYKSMEDDKLVADG